MQYQAKLVEGRFRREPEGLVVSTPRGDQRLDEILRPFEGMRVHVAAHHLPHHPINLNLRGGGSCHLEGECSAGHHWRPTFLYNVSLNGVLCPSRIHAGDWCVVQFDGGTIELSLHEFLPDHTARVAIASEDTVVKMRELVDPSVEGVGSKATDVQTLAGQLPNNSRKFE